MKQVITIIIAGFGIVLAIFLLIVLAFIGILFFYEKAVGDKVEKLKKNFNTNETEFAELTMFLEKKYVIYPKYSMWLTLENKEHVSITLLGSYESRKEDIIIKNANLKSSSVDSILHILEWDYADLIYVINKLKKIKCRKMSVSDSLYGGINITLFPSGFPKANYIIFSKSWLEHRKMYNISETELGRRTEMR